MERVIVAGCSGAGKTTLAAAIAARRGLLHVELDAVFHGPGRTKRDEFEDEVEQFTAGRGWACEDMYFARLGSLLWERADTVVWLDLPRRTVMRRVIGRSLARVLTRRRLWNGNRETWRDLFDPHQPIRWAWNNYTPHRQTVAARIQAHPQIRVVHLTSASRARAWLNSLDPSSEQAANR
jgi:adenylate kinase family enzyme